MKTFKEYIIESTLPIYMDNIYNSIWKGEDLKQQDINDVLSKNYPIRIRYKRILYISIMCVIHNIKIPKELLNIIIENSPPNIDVRSQADVGTVIRNSFGKERGSSLRDVFIFDMKRYYKKHISTMLTNNPELLEFFI